MDNATNRGYARLIFDLANSDHDGSFQQELAKKQDATQELSRLLRLAKELGSRKSGEIAAKSDQPGGRHSD